MQLVLVDVAQHLAAHVLLAGLGVGHDAFRSREDGDAQTVQHAGHVRNRRILAQTGTAHALEVLDGVGLRGGVPLQRDLDRGVSRLGGVELVSDEVALLLEDLGDLLFNFGTGSFNHFVVGFHRVSNSGQKVRDRISHNE